MTDRALLRLVAQLKRLADAAEERNALIREADRAQREDNARSAAQSDQMIRAARSHHVADPWEDPN